LLLTESDFFSCYYLFNRKVTFSVCLGVQEGRRDEGFGKKKGGKGRTDNPPTWMGWGLFFIVIQNSPVGVTQKMYWKGIVLHLDNFFKYFPCLIESEEWIKNLISLHSVLVSYKWSWEFTFIVSHLATCYSRLSYWLSLTPISSIQLA
jgi:hypothetical protein